MLPTEIVLKIVEFMPDHPEADLDNRFSEADLDNRLFLSVCLGRSAFEKLVVKGVVWVDEKWREIRKAKSERSKMIMKQTYSNVVSLFFVFAISLLFSVIGPLLIILLSHSILPLPTGPCPQCRGRKGARRRPQERHTGICVQATTKGALRDDGGTQE